MRTLSIKRRKSSRGFTIAEMAVSTAIVTFVILGVFNLFIAYLRSYNASTLMRISASRASFTLERMVYGVGTNSGLREAQQTAVIISNGAAGYWRISPTNNLYFQWSPTTKSITDQSGKTIGTNIIASTLSGNSDGCTISVSVAETGGGRIITNSMTTFVQYRN